MRTFTRADNRTLEVVEGFGERMLSYRPSVTPKAHWTDEQYALSAEAKRRRFNRLIAGLERWDGGLDGARVLDMGCGDGANCLLFAELPVAQVVGIDLHLPLFASDEKGARARRLAGHLLSAGARGSADDAIASRPAGEQAAVDLPPTVRFLTMDATRMSLREGSFDVVISRSAMEHIMPIELALAEMARVVRPGGLIYLAIDPFYWLRGCHKRGVVDIPWAHARLTPEEYRRFVAAHEGEDVAAKRTKRLATLNRFTVAEWRERIDAMPCGVLDWNERRSAVGEEVLTQYPDALETLLPGVGEEDLLCERVEVWLTGR